MLAAEEVEGGLRQRSWRGVDRWECGGTRARGRRHQPPRVPIRVLGNEDSDGEEREGPGRPGCRSKVWAHGDQRDEICKIRDWRRDRFSQLPEDRDHGFVQSSMLEMTGLLGSCQRASDRCERRVFFYERERDATKTVRLAAASGSPIRVEGEASLGR